jgi:hypothetical protein
MRDSAHRVLGRIPALACALIIGSAWPVPVDAGDPSASSGEELEIEVSKKGLGKEVSIKQGTKEWFMLVEVTPENTVVIRQEKDNENYLVDESETHDRPLSAGEVDAAIDAYVNSVKARAKQK